jgi:hypothetical protein
MGIGQQTSTHMYTEYVQRDQGPRRGVAGRCFSPILLCHAMIRSETW